VLRRLADRGLQRTTTDRQVRTLVHNVLTVVTYVIAVLSAVVVGGVNVAVLLTVAGLGTVAIGLALQDILRNILAGIWLLLEHPFLLGRLEEATEPQHLNRIFAETRERGNEGLMVKDPISPYTPGRRGLAWLKLKRPLATLDVVVTAVEWGHGKRKGVLSDYTFAVKDTQTDRLVNVGKAYSGLTDAEIAEFTRRFLDITVQDMGHVRMVRPEVVLEVAFDSIQHSGRHMSGYALRFPRIVRTRDEKPVDEIDTLERVAELYERYFGEKSAVPLSEVAET